jgi:hypothetical protein
VSLTGNVSTSGSFVSLDILTEKGWNKSKMNVSSIIHSIRSELVNNHATIDMRVKKGYNTTKSILEEDKLIVREIERNKISTTNSFEEQFRIISSQKMNEIGDNIILPPSASSKISNSERPHIFEIKGQSSRIYGKINLKLKNKVALVTGVWSLLHRKDV